MISNEIKNEIMKLSIKGYSNVYIANEIGCNRRTVIKYRKEMNELNDKLKETEVGSTEFHEIMEQIAGPPQYKGKYKERPKRKLTPEIKDRINEILEDENRKIKLYGLNHKNKRNIKDFHEILVNDGYDISYTTVRNYVSPKIKKMEEVYIRQTYDFGQRLEFDFGERWVTIDGKKTKVYIAVLCSAATNYRDYYVYSNKSNESFIDSQVRFFKKHGVYQTVVYDNMRNVVKKFVGRNKRELTDLVLSLSNYYEFEIVLANPYAGNEKGHVERSVNVVGHELFANKDVFDSWEELIEHVNKTKKALNKGTDIKTEMKYLKEAKPPYEFAEINERKVNKYCFIRDDNNSYSVPEQYVGARVTVKRYPHTIEIYYRGKLIAKHRRIHDKEQYSVDIRHYLKTLLRKPGALKNSVALDQVPKLKEIYENYYTENPRDFLVILMDNKESLDTEELYEQLRSENIRSASLPVEKTIVEKASLKQLVNVSTLFNGGLNESHL